MRMTKHYAIRLVNELGKKTEAYLCGDNKIIAGWCSGMGRKDTLVYAKLGNARRKVNKIQWYFSPLEIYDLRTESVVK